MEDVLLTAQDKAALDDIITAQKDRENGFKDYDADYVLKEMDEIINSN